MGHIRHDRLRLQQQRERRASSRAQSSREQQQQRRGIPATVDPATKLAAAKAKAASASFDNPPTQPGVTYITTRHWPTDDDGE